MSELTLIYDLALIWLVALVAGYLCICLKQSAITGYILAGIAIGPYGLRLISHPEQVSVLSELGVALLLFALGVEVSLRRVLSSSPRLLAAGAVQIVATTAAAWLLAYHAGIIPTPATGLLFGCICALSSTVVVTKMLMDRGEIDAIHGRILVPILLMQDLSLVPVVSLIPVLDYTHDRALWGVFLALAKGALLVACVVLGATKVVPRLMSGVARANSRELFLLAIISLCLGIAIIGQQLGLSLALGAFLAGIMVSESPYGHQALADLIPLKDLFSVVFFASVGMLLNPAFITEHWLQVLVFVLVLVAGKAVIAGLAALLATPSRRSATLVGVGLAQMGEFSFVLAVLGFQSGIITSGLYNLFFAGAVVSLIASPFLMTVVPGLLQRLARASDKSVRRFDRRERERPAGARFELSGHVILCGYGRIGRNLGAVLENHRLPFAVVELNAAILEDLAARNVPYVYGDATSSIVLLQANLRTAAALVVTAADPLAAITIIGIARQYNPGISIIARAHRSADIEMLRSVGANAVVQPELEASIEVTRLSLVSLNCSDSEIQEALSGIRGQRYQLYEPDVAKADLERLLGIPHEDQCGAWYRIDSPDVAGRTIQALDVRKQTGVTVMAIRCRGQVVAHPPPDTLLEMHSEIYVVGNTQQLGNFERVFELPRFCSV